MGAIFRGIATYFVLLLFSRLYGRRTIGQITTFDFLLLLIISEASQQALLGNDYSVTNAVLVLLTLFAADHALSTWKHRSKRAESWLEGTPLVLVEDGKPIKKVCDSVQIDESDILSAARELRGLERMDQIKYAILEINGKITIVPEASHQNRSAA